MSEQQPYVDPFQDQKFADNPEPRCPCVLVLDISGSMGGQPIAELNSGLKAFREELAADSLAAKRVELALVTFGGQVSQVCGFTTADQFQPPILTAQGDTPMGSAIETAIEMVEQEKQRYRTNGVAYYRPWIFMITDGGPTDGDRWISAAQKVKDGEANKKFAFFCVGVHGAKTEILTQISVRAPLMLDGLKFRELFVWLSTSQKNVSRSTPGDEVPLSAPSGWATV